MSAMEGSETSTPARDATDPTPAPDDEDTGGPDDVEDVEDVEEDARTHGTVPERIWEILSPGRATGSKEVKVSSSRPPEVVSPLEQQLSDLVRSFSIAINARQFDVSRSPWCDNLDVKFAGAPSKAETATARKSGVLNAVEYVEHLRRLVEKHPAYHIDVERIDCFKDPGQGLAQVFLNYDVRGVPPGVTRKSVAIFKLRRNAGNVWRCYNVQSADGMAGSEGGAGAGF